MRRFGEYVSDFNLMQNEHKVFEHSYSIEVSCKMLECMLTTQFTVCRYSYR